MGLHYFNLSVEIKNSFIDVVGIAFPDCTDALLMQRV
jgi:hypothetical protein